MRKSLVSDALVHKLVPLKILLIITQSTLISQKSKIPGVIVEEVPSSIHSHAPR